jgi:hypothetical protein
MEPRRFRLIAMGVAVAALVVSIGAVARSRPPETRLVFAAPVAAPLAPQDRTVVAADLARLSQPDLAIADYDGLRVIDSELAQRLRLAPGERVVSISGRTLRRKDDVTEVLDELARLDVNVLYVELWRDDTLSLVRWRIDGRLSEAMVMPHLRHAPPPPSPIVPAMPAPDDPAYPVITGLTRHDDAHFTITRAAADAFIADMVGMLRGVGLTTFAYVQVPTTIRLRTIQPTSVLAHLGFQFGDRIDRIERTKGGIEITVTRGANARLLTILVK